MRGLEAVTHSYVKYTQTGLAPVALPANIRNSSRMISLNRKDASEAAVVMADKPRWTDGFDTLVRSPTGVRSFFTVLSKAQHAPVVR